VEKLRVSVTDRCNHRCFYCMPKEGVPLVEHGEVLRYEEVRDITAAMVETAGLLRVRLTGGEPLLRFGVANLVAMLKETGVEEVSLTTNGALLPRYAEALREAGMNRINVSLDTLDPKTYGKITGGGSLDRALAGLASAQKAGFAPIKVNCVVIRGVNDQELPAMVRFAAQEGFVLRFLEAMRIGELRENHAEHFVSLREMTIALSKEFDVEVGDHPLGATSRPLRLRSPTLNTEVGAIPSESAPFCHGCARLRLTVTGLLMPCLLGGEGLDLRQWVRSTPRSVQGFSGLVREAMNRKPLLRGREQAEYMSRIGG